MSQANQQQTMEFPAKSKRTTDETFTFDEVRAELDAVIMARAEFVAEILLAMKERFGDEVFEIAKQAIYNIGYRKGKRIAAGAKNRDLQDLFDGMTSKLDTLYWGFTADHLSDEVLVTHVEQCPLPRKWKQMGMSDDEIIQFCAMFDHIDKGVVAGYRDDLEVENTGVRTLAKEGYCGMTVRVVK